MASTHMTVHVRARGIWRARLAITLCSWILRHAPTRWTTPLCRAALWCSWFRLRFDIAGKRSTKWARLRITDEAQ